LIATSTRSGSYTTSRDTIEALKPKTNNPRQEREKIVIHFMRSATIAPGKIGDAIAFANDISRFIKDNYGTDVVVLMPVGGNPSRIAWHANYDSLAQWQELADRSLRDPNYMEIIAKNSATFLPGSVQDEIWRTL
jgi:hypothetical protein